MNRHQVGVAGAVLLFLGVFMPMMSAPVVGNVNYFRNGSGDGVGVVFLALVAGFLLLKKKYRLLWIPGSLSLVLLLFTLLWVQSEIAAMKVRSRFEMKDNPFGGLAEAAISSVQLQWGWAVLVLGAVCLLVAAFMKDAPTTSPA